MRLIGVVAAIALAATSLVSRPALAGGKMEKTGDCEYTITVRVAIFGDPADSDRAKQMKDDFEKLWNGPDGRDAEVIGSNLGIETRDVYVGDQGSESLADNRNKIEAEYEKYAKEFGLDTTCAYMNCCVIKFRADVIVVEGYNMNPEGYHQVRIVPDGTTETVTENGVEKQVPFRSYVEMVPTVDNPSVSKESDWRLPQPGDDTYGRWTNADVEDSADAHEMGHLLGLDDTYIEAGGSQEGHGHNIMTDINGFPYEEGFDQIKNVWGIKCDECCPEDDVDGIWQDFGITTLALGDAIQICDKAQIQNLLDRLKMRRKGLSSAKIAAREKVRLASSLDKQIADAEAALAAEDCDKPRPVTGTVGYDYSLGGLLPNIEYAVESTDWCTFGEGTPTTTDDGDDPRDTPPPPEDGDDPRDTPPPPEDGDDPRDTPPPPGEDDGDDPRDTPPPPEDDDGDDPRDIPKPTITIPEDDGDDPRDTPDEDEPEDPPTEEDDGDDPRDVPVAIKAKKAALDENGAVRKAQAPARSQNIKFFDPMITNMDLPAPGAEKVDTAYNAEPMQCTTDENGECTINVPVCEEDDPKNCPLGLKAEDVSKNGYEFEVAVAPTRGQILKVDDEAMRASGRKNYENDIEELTVTGAKITTDDLELNGYKYFSTTEYEYDLGTEWKVGLDLSWKLDTSWALQIDYCRDKKPGPPLGWTPIDYDEGDAVPSQMISFGEEIAP